MADYTLEILTTNYSGQIASIVFSPCSGGTINLGNQILPYNYVSEYIYGDYELTFSAYGGSQCFLSIPCPSPTPTNTPTSTVTPTVTTTVTPTVTPTPTSIFELKVESALSTVTINNLIAVAGFSYTITSGSFPATNTAVLGSHSSTGTLGTGDVLLTFDASTSSTFTITKNGVEIVNFPATSGIGQTYQLGGQFSNLLTTDVMVLKFA